MRYLHPVGVSERFVASGKYTQHGTDKPPLVVESWAIHALPDGSQLVRVDMDTRRIDGRSALVEAWVSPPETGDVPINGAEIAGAISRIDISAFGGPDDAIKRGRATYLLDGTMLEVGRTLDKNERIYEEMTLPAGIVVANVSTILGGFGGVVAAGRASDHPDGIPTLHIELDLTGPDALSAAVFTQTVTLTGEETISLGEKTVAASRYDCRYNDANGEVAMPPFWADEHAVTLRDEQVEGAYVLLTDYARRK